MYGKFFASTFTGSMVGAGSDVFAVWGYCIANGAGGQVELNPRILATILGCTIKEVEAAIEFLCSPDPKSRSPESDGKRLIKVGSFAYLIPNYLKYRSIRNEEERREYNRRKQAEHRASNRLSMTVNDMSAVSAHADADADAEGVRARAREGTPPGELSLKAPEDVAPPNAKRRKKTPAAIEFNPLPSPLFPRTAEAMLADCDQAIAEIKRRATFVQTTEKAGASEYPVEVMDQVSRECIACYVKQKEKIQRARLGVIEKPTVP